ncbi:MAG: hypothetical protein H6707_18595 [Deltaproteobacteria bacterium]|nr:hypothetical protein [Deltaproteobacteria bacterium]
MRPSVYLLPKDVRLGQKWLRTSASSKRIVSGFVIDLNRERRRRDRRPSAMPHQHRIIELLDQAERFRSRISAGDVNQADLARLHGITRARVTQILNLLRLHPVIVNYLRARGYIGYGRAPTERLLRPLVALSAERQLRAAEEGLVGFREYREGGGGAFRAIAWSGG